MQAAHANKLRHILFALDAAASPAELNHPGFGLHPLKGELLREEVSGPLGIKVTEAAQRLGMSRTALSRVIHGRAGISPDLAMRLERAGVSTARFWMMLQANYELAQAEQRRQPKVQLLQDTA